MTVRRELLRTGTSLIDGEVGHSPAASTRHDIKTLLIEHSMLSLETVFQLFVQSSSKTFVRGHAALCQVFICYPWVKAPLSRSVKEPQAEPAVPNGARIGAAHSDKVQGSLLDVADGTCARRLVHNREVVHLQVPVNPGEGVGRDSAIGAAIGEVPTQGVVVALQDPEATRVVVVVERQITRRIKDIGDRWQRVSRSLVVYNGNCAMPTFDASSSANMNVPMALETLELDPFPDPLVHAWTGQNRSDEGDSTGTVHVKGSGGEVNIVGLHRSQRHNTSDTPPDSAALRDTRLTGSTLDVLARTFTH